MCLSRFLPTLVLILISTSFLVSADNDKTLTIELEKGQLLSIIEPIRNEGKEADAALKRYYDVAINLAQSYGYKNHGVLRVVDTLDGEPRPRIFALATWPDAESDAAFESLPMWQEYKALRPVIWKTLRFYKSSAQHASSLVFKNDHTYLVSFYWSQMDQQEAISKVSTLIEDKINRAGGKIKHQMFQPRFDTHSAPFEGPNLVVVSEWSKGINKETLDKVIHRVAGVKEQEIYKVAPIIK